MRNTTIVLLVITTVVACGQVQHKGVRELQEDVKILNSKGTIVSTRFNPPIGFERVKTDSNSFAFYLQRFILKPDGTKVYYYDMAMNSTTGEKLYLLAQSYMPAQSIHILKNSINTGISPWYRLDASQTIIYTPEWTFYTEDLRRF